MAELFDSKHFTLERLADGIYAAFARDDGTARSNAGIVDLGDRVILFDTSFTPQSARDLVTAAEQVTGRPVTTVVNSHWHGDHVLGNQSTPATATVISTARTREIAAERIPATIERLKTNLPQDVSDLEAKLAAETDPDKRQEIDKNLAVTRMVAEGLSSLTCRLPDQTFERRMTFHGQGRRAELITFGGGHTESDAVLYLPDDGIAFVADLLFQGFHPWLRDGDPDEWLRIYADIEALDPAVRVVVPGHGPVAGREAFAALREYLAALHELTADIVAKGGTADSAAEVEVPAAFGTWIGGQQIFTQNMRFLIDRLLA